MYRPLVMLKSPSLSALTRRLQGQHLQLPMPCIKNAGGDSVEFHLMLTLQLRCFPERPRGSVAFLFSK
jgi:hypothetical protein